MRSLPWDSKTSEQDDPCQPREGPTDGRKMADFTELERRYPNLRFFTSDQGWLYATLPGATADGATLTELERSIQGILANRAKPTMQRALSGGET